MDGKESYTEEAVAQQVTSTDKNNTKWNKESGLVAAGKNLAERNRRVREVKKKRCLKAIRSSEGSRSQRGRIATRTSTGGLRPGAEWENHHHSHSLKFFNSFWWRSTPRPKAWLSLINHNQNHSEVKRSKTHTHRLPFRGPALKGCL